MSRRELILRANPEYLAAIENSYARAASSAAGDDPAISPYWKLHRSLAGFEILDRCNGTIRIHGESGFYFPGCSYSSLEWINTLDRLLWLTFSGWRRQAPVEPKALSFSIPRGRKNYTRFGYPFGAQRTAYDFLRAGYHLACITPHLPAEIGSGARRLNSIEIGPGTGLCALAVKLLIPNSTLVLVDLPETLAFSSVFLATVLPECRFLFLDGFARDEKSWREFDFVLLPPDAARRLPSGSFDLALNTDSMQEMELASIREYFALLRRLLRPPALFYSSNRTEKWIGSGTTRLADYPYVEGDRDLFSRENLFMHHRWIWKKFHYRIPYPWREPRRGGEVMIQKLTAMKTNEK
ncbi:MAG: putative sugar O-methyltransferase [Anaerolineales bacterium]